MTVEGRHRTRRVGKTLATVNEVVFRVLRSIPLPGRGATGRPVRLEHPVEEPVILRLEAYSSNIIVETTATRSITVQGRAESKDSVWLTVKTDKGRRIATLTVRDANLIVKAPTASIGIIADSSNVKIQATMTELDYLSVNLDSSRLRATIRLKPEGGVYAKLDSSAANIKVQPSKQGPHWLEAKLYSSILGFTVEGGADYELVEKKTRDSWIKTKGKGRIPVRAWLHADSSTVKLS